MCGMSSAEIIISNLRITLDTMLKHPQIINMEPFLKNKLPQNNLNDRVTFAYQYSWKDVWQQCFWILKWVTGNTSGMWPWWLTSIAICEKSSSMTPYESMCKLLYKDATVQNQPRLYQMNMPIFCYSYLKSVHLTCSSMWLPFTWMHPLCLPLQMTEDITMVTGVKITCQTELNIFKQDKTSSHKWCFNIQTVVSIYHITRQWYISPSQLS